MLAELNASDIQRLAPAFSAIYAEYVILAVMEGNCRARAWADNPQDPDIAVLWDERHCIYVAFGRPIPGPGRRNCHLPGQHRGLLVHC